mmetsp:Transcript_9180/g.21319  ORF Transcript_9180/g.21319 Transcript_9180/m.21319 type:complete len:356 (+) Transcript_9180:1607-2674(+)
MPGHRRARAEGRRPPRVRRVPLAARRGAPPGADHVLPRRELARQGRGVPCVRDVLPGVPGRVRAGARDSLREVDRAAHRPDLEREGGRGRGARGRRGGVRARPVREGPGRRPEKRFGREGPARHVPRGLRENPERHRRAHEPAAVQLRQPRPEAAEGRRGADRLLELRREQAQGAVGGDGRVRLPAKGALRAVPRPGLDRARGRRRDGRHAAAADDGARRRLPAVSLSPERRPEDDALAPAPADRGGARQAPVQDAVPRPVRGPPGQEPRREERDVAAFGPRGGAVRRGPGVADRPGGVPGQARGGGYGRGFRLRQGHGGEAEGEGSGRRGWQVPRRCRGDVPFPLWPPDDRLGS